VKSLSALAKKTLCCDCLEYTRDFYPLVAKTCSAWMRASHLLRKPTKAYRGSRRDHHQGLRDAVKLTASKGCMHARTLPATQLCIRPLPRPTMPLPTGSNHVSSGGLMQLLSPDLDQNGQDEQPRDRTLRNIYSWLQTLLYRSLPHGRLRTMLILKGGAG
jgi:hypothetical protein